MKKRILIIALYCILIIGVNVTIFFTTKKPNYKVIYEIPDYQSYVDMINQKQTPSEPPELPEAMPAIKGFAPIINKSFDFAKKFNGNLTYVTHSMENYIINSNGDMKPTQNDLTRVELINDKYIFKDLENDKLGVKNIFGDVIISPLYDSCQINNDTILMKKGNTAYIFINDTKISQSSFTDDVSLYNSDTIFKDSYYCDLNFKEFAYKKYTILSPFIEDMCIISEDFISYGYISKDGKDLIEPKFEKATDFVNGYAMVTIDKHSAIIDKSGKILFDGGKDGENNDEKIEIYNFYDGYFCFKANGKKGVMDSHFKVVTEAKFEQISMNRVYGSFIIDNVSKQQLKFYSILTNKFDDRAFKLIEPFNDGFICQKEDNNYCLLDCNLNVLIDNLDYAAYSQNILMIKQNNKYYLYKKLN